MRENYEYSNVLEDISLRQFNPNPSFYQKNKILLSSHLISGFYGVLIELKDSRLLKVISTPES